MAGDDNTRRDQSGLKVRARNALFEQLMAHRSRLRKAIAGGENTTSLNREIEKILDELLKLDIIAFNDLNGNPNTKPQIEALKKPIADANREAQRLKQTADSLNTFTRAATSVISLAESVIGVIT